MAICTREQVLNHLRLSDNKKDEVEIDRLIPAAQAMFERYCNRLFDEATYTEFYNGDSTDKLFVKNGPIISVTSIHDDNDHAYGADTLIAVTDYGTINDIYIQLFGGSWFQTGVNNVKIIYIAGYGGAAGGGSIAVPADLTQASIEQISWMFKRGKQHLYGISGKTLEDSSFQLLEQGGLLPSVKTILDGYRRINVG